MGWRKDIAQGERVFPSSFCSYEKVTDVTGWVYIAGAYDRERLVFVKIGYTSRKNPNARMRELQQGGPHEIKLLCATPGCRTLERSWMQEFRKAHVNGEWFEPSGYILARVDTINAMRNSWKPWWGKKAKTKRPHYR